MCFLQAKSQACDQTEAMLLTLIAAVCVLAGQLNLSPFYPSHVIACHVMCDCAFLCAARLLLVCSLLMLRNFQVMSAPSASRKLLQVVWMLLNAYNTHLHLQ